MELVNAAAAFVVEHPRVLVLVCLLVLVVVGVVGQLLVAASTPEPDGYCVKPRPRPVSERQGYGAAWLDPRR